MVTPLSLPGSYEAVCLLRLIVQRCLDRRRVCHRPGGCDDRLTRCRSPQRTHGCRAAVLIGMQNLDLVQRTWANQDPVDMASCIYIGEVRRRFNSTHGGSGDRHPRQWLPSVDQTLRAGTEHTAVRSSARRHRLQLDHTAHLWPRKAEGEGSPACASSRSPPRCPSR